jgi:cysteinyl-tRNA synthetase
MSEIRLYNTLTRRRDVLEPRDPGRVGLYVCGPTVYDDAHLGHARVYVVFDTLVRFLEHRGLEVRYVRNITDLDDKIIARARERGTSVDEITGAYTRSFHEDMSALNVRPATVEPRATEHIPEMIDIITRLERAGLAYRVDGDVYFPVTRFGPYGKLSGHDPAQLRDGARVEVDERLEHPRDFALWKASKPGEPSWDSPWGPGRPGWHIECSAMSLKYLGGGFDIHGGGLDLVFPHHENEIAQAEGATGEPFCRMFVHNGFVNVNKEKMAKSKGNFFLIRQVLEHAHPEAVRLFLLGTHYRGPIDLQVTIGPGGELEGMPQVAEAQRRVEYYYETIEKLELLASRDQGAEVPGQIRGEASDLAAAVDASLSDDLNTALAVGHLNDFMRRANDLADRGGGLPKRARPAAAAHALGAVREVGSILGILASTPEAFTGTERHRKLARTGLSEEQVEARIEERNRARASKDWPRADAIRDELDALGIELRDAGGGTRWTVRG